MDNKAPYFEMPNDPKEAHAQPLLTSMRVPHPTNTKAKQVDAAKVMGQVLRGK